MRIFAIVLIISGVALRAYVFFYMKNCFSLQVKVPPRMLEKGIYKYIRHPMYLGGLISYAGIAIMATNCFWGWLALWILGYSMIVERIYQEEELMKKYFGKQYTNYMARTAMLIPFLI